MNVEPVDAAFEAEVARLAGKRQERESVEDHLKRIRRIRLGLRHWWPTQSEQAVADARTSGYANGAAGIAGRILALLPKAGEFTGNCCEHCAAIEDLLEPVRPAHRTATHDDEGTGR